MKKKIGIGLTELQEKQLTALYLIFKCICKVSEMLRSISVCIFLLCCSGSTLHPNLFGWKDILFQVIHEAVEI
jgi:hypothetical protein